MTSDPVPVEQVEPCPWCGSEPYFAHGENGLWQVGCSTYDDCLASLTYGHFARKAEALAAWNTRAHASADAPAPAVGDVERLRQREAMATPAPWQLQDGNSHRRIGVPGKDGNVIRPGRYSEREPHVLTLDGERIYADLLLVVEARNALPGLLDTIEALTATLAATQKQLAEREALLAKVVACRKPPATVQHIHGTAELGESWSISELTALLPELRAFLQQISAPAAGEQGEGA